MAAEPGSARAARIRARIGSRDASAAAGSSITATSSTVPGSNRQINLSRQYKLSVCHVAGAVELPWSRKSPAQAGRGSLSRGGNVGPFGTQGDGRGEGGQLVRNRRGYETGRVMTLPG